MAPKPTSRGEYIETETGNKISRRASILGTKHIILAGKCVIQHDVLVHGDLVTPRSTSSSSTNTTSSNPNSNPNTKDPKPSSSSNSTPAETVSIHLGRYVFISPGVTLHPPSRLSTASSSTASSSTAQSPTPTQTQTLTYHPLRISDHVFIGSNSHIRAASIGSHVYIGSNVTVGNLCIIKDNVRVEDGAVLPAGSMWASGCVVAGSPGRVVGEVGEAWGFEGGVGVGGVALMGSRERWLAVGNKR